MRTPSLPAATTWAERSATWRFGGYLGWLGVVVAADAVAWLGFRSRLVSIWLAVVSLLPPLAVLSRAGWGSAGTTWE